MENAFDKESAFAARSIILATEVVGEDAIFSLERTNAIMPTAAITHMQVSKNVIVVAMTNNSILRYEIGKDATQEDIKISRVVEDLVHNLFLDPTGRHLIISMQSAENFYLSRNSKAVRPLNKAKGHLLDSVGWNRFNSDDGTTREILVGTNAGLIFETKINANEETKLFQSNVDQYWSQLYNLGQSITGIEFERMPSTGESRYFMLVTTPDRFYQFTGPLASPQNPEPPIFQAIFATYERIPGGAKFLEFPGSFGYSDLKLYYPKHRSLPDSFAWMTGPGVYYGQVDASGGAGTDNVTSKTKLLSYHTVDGERLGLPLGIALTKFHVVVAYTDSIKAVCVLTDQVVYSHHTQQELGSKIMGLCRDTNMATIWLHTSHAVYQIRVNREVRNVWQIYMDMGEFTLARNYCQNAEQENQVVIREAEHFYAKEDYLKAAELFANTSLMFEEVALKLIHLPDKEPLKEFLLHKVTSLEIRSGGGGVGGVPVPAGGGVGAQRTLLVLWLVEIFLDQLGRLRDLQSGQVEEQFSLQRDFRRFLSLPIVKETLHEARQTVYDLIDSHGNVQDMVFFANLMQDFGRVVSHYIQEEEYDKALEVLVANPRSSLHYRYGPALIAHLPQETIETWIKLGPALKPEKLLPGLLQARPEHSVRYLEYAVDNGRCRDLNLHNLLVSVYASLSASASSPLEQGRLLAYLEREGSYLFSVAYDPQYAMRVCAEHGNLRASVFLHSMLGMYQEAVEDALGQNDIELAKEITRTDTIDFEIRKQLWMRIARHVVEKEKDVKEATKIVVESELLKLEDILPFFPEFVTIDHFKDAICESLEKYNKQIEDLKEDMFDSTKGAEEIRSQIQAFRLRYATVELDHVCSECNFPLLLRTFYLFPCGHFFHTDCLTRLMKPHLTPAKLDRFSELSASISSGSLNSSVQSFRSEFDDIIASDCPFCGQVAIDSVDELFINPENYYSERATWD